MEEGSEGRRLMDRGRKEDNRNGGKCHKKRERGRLKGKKGYGN